MKKLLTMGCLAVLTAFAGCTRCIEYPGLPDCVKTSIQANKNSDNGMVGQVTEYRYQNLTVYAFEPDNRVIADGSTTIITSNCDTLCYVGGFGGTDVVLCNGKNFYREASLIRVVWSKY